MDKKPISANLPGKLIKYMDKVADNRSNFIAKSLLNMIDDVELIKSQIQVEKQKRDQLIDKKQTIEKKIEDQRDTVRELENWKTEAKTLRKVRKNIPQSEIQKIRDIVRQNKYDSDPRSYSTDQVIKKGAQRLAKESDNLTEEEVRKVLELTVEL